MQTPLTSSSILSNKTTTQSTTISLPYSTSSFKEKYHQLHAHSSKTLTFFACTKTKMTYRNSDPSDTNCNLTNPCISHCNHIKRLIHYNYACRIDGGMDFIIKAMQLSFKCHIIIRQQILELLTCAAVFIDLTNMFNLVSWEELFDIIDTHFPKLTLLTTLSYKTPADVHFKWNTSSWISIAMKEGVNLGCHSHLSSLILS